MMPGPPQLCPRPVFWVGTVLVAYQFLDGSVEVQTLCHVLPWLGIFSVSTWSNHLQAPCYVVAWFGACNG